MVLNSINSSSNKPISVRNVQICSVQTEVCSLAVAKLLYVITNKMVTKGGAKIKKKTVMMNEFPEDIESKLQKMIGLEDLEPDVIVEKSNIYVK